MVFNTWQFVLFFPLVTLAFFALAPANRRGLLIAASSVFYMAFVPQYILIIFALILLDYAAALMIESAHGTRRRTYLVLSIAGNLGMLGVFKYYDFFNHNLAAVFAWLGVRYGIADLALVLPIGLSFHTFQSLAYTIEVYNGRYTAERSLSRYALYVLFYPQLVAGPIERPSQLLPQLNLTAGCDAERVTDGLKLMVWGLFKKMVVADRLAAVVTAVYGNPSQFQGPQLAIATVFFAYQIYCDFSGYTDVAIGAAQVMGIRLMTNFNRPYAATFISDFWARWHISLTTWFRDYLYAPVAGKRPAPLRRHAATWLVFLTSGLWHGAAWNFVAWGALHAFYMSAGTLTANRRARMAGAIGLTRVPRVRRALQITTTFTLVSLSWVLFRANTLADAATVFRGLPHGWARLSGGLAGVLAPMQLTAGGLVKAILLIAAVEIVSSMNVGERMRRMFCHLPLYVRWPAYVGLIVTILDFGAVERIPFIYFQF
jgi:alginate O-acetyltransferase complex protein AlgI